MTAKGRVSTQQAVARSGRRPYDAAASDVRKGSQRGLFVVNLLLLLDRPQEPLPDWRLPANGI